MAPTIPRRNGIPLLGLGTYPLTGAQAENTIAMAIDLGYRHIDTAQMYGNEGAVGRAVAAAAVPRDELFIVTKVDPGNVGKESFRASVEKSVQELGTPPDVLLIHWPPPDSEIDGALDRLMDAQDRGLTRHIGVSNFTANMLRKAQARCAGRLACNQVEFHPLMDQTALRTAAESVNVVLTAYRPLARGAALKPQVLQDIAQRRGRPVSEIVLRWIVQLGVAAIPMTSKRENAESNLRIFSFELSDADMAAISALGTADGRMLDPGWMKGRWND